jgi:hypothetical protein
LSDPPRPLGFELLPGETIAGVFPVRVLGEPQDGELAISSRRLLFQGARGIMIPYRRIVEIRYEYGYRTADVFALPNEVVVRTDAGAFRLFFLGEDDQAQERAARRARDLMMSCRAQNALLERLM